MARAKKQLTVAEGVQPPLLGAMSNLFGGSPEEVAAVFARYTLESVQILPSFPGMRLSKNSVDPSMCEAMAGPFLDQEIQVAAVSAYTNFIDPDAERRSRMVNRFNLLIENCDSFGTSCLVTSSGTLNPEHPLENFPENHSDAALSALVEALRPSVKLAEDAGVTILIEGYLYHVVSSTSRARKVREELGDHVGFVMDPASLFTRGMASSPKRSLREIFNDLGALAPIAHGKDVRYVGGELNTPRAGTGVLDYKEFLELLYEYQGTCPLILKQLRPEELRETIDFIDRFYD